MTDVIDAPVQSAPVRVLKKATFLQLAFMIYGVVCAGAFGLEDMISGAGPGITLLTLIFMPFLFSIPLSLAVAELTTTFPVEGGNYRWSRMSFGDFWGFQAGWWGWMSGIVTNSSFVVLFADYFQQADWLGGAWIKAHPMSPWPWLNMPHWFIGLALVWLVYWLNVRGIDVVGNSSIALSILLLIPFVIMCFIGAGHWHFNPFQPFMASGKGFLSLGTALAISIWLYSGYEKLSSAAEEVENPTRIFPPALFFAATLAMLSYALPPLFALAELGNPNDWAGAYFPKAAELMGGMWLGRSMTIGGLLSNALLLNVTVLSVSRIPVALAADGLLPTFFEHTDERYGTPVRSLLFGSVLISLLCLFNFQQLAIIYAWFQIITNAVIYLNAIALRRQQPEAPRPFRVPFGQGGLIAMMAPTVLLGVIGLGTTLFKDGVFSRTQLLIAAVALLSGPIVYLAVGRSGERPQPSAQP